MTTARDDAVATLALATYSLAVTFGFVRVFDGWTFLPELALLTLLGHGWSFVARRRRLSAWIELPVAGALLGLVATNLRYPGSAYPSATPIGLPTGRTWDRFVLELELVTEQFPTAVAPVPYTEGWASLAVIGIVLSVLLADTFAFRAGARAEALVPGGVLFVFISALADDRLRTMSAIVLIAAGVVAVGALRSLHDRSVALHGSVRLVPLTTVAVGATALGVALLAGIVGPRLPGANADPIYETRGRNGVTTIVSPLVDIRSRLTSRGDEELFRVDADSPGYWRVTTLAAFDGRRFTLPRRALDRIDVASNPDVASERIRQQIQIIGLGGQLVPAAAEPVGAEGSRDGMGIELRVNRDSNSLLSPDDLLPGDLFRIVSEQPAPDLGALRAAPAAAGPDPLFTELPDDLPDVVGRLARDVAGAATTPFDAVLALQTWFRDPSQFSYSLDVQPGHGSTAIELFIDRRVGYCEQFAATFAAMARSLGIPARVAVGFTPGVRGEDGWYRVLGKNAHAWPEVWFDGIGWLPFEPTPGRGIPGAETYTGIAAAQDEDPPDTAPTDTTATTGPTSSTDPNPADPADPADDIAATADDTAATTVAPASPSLAGAGNDPVDPTIAPDETGDESDDNTQASRSVTTAAALVLAAIALGASLVAARSAIVRRRRRRPASERIMRAWSRARQAAIDVGVDGRPSMTHREWAEALAVLLPIAARPMASLATVAEQIDFAPHGRVDTERIGSFGVPLVRECEQWAEQVERLAADAVPRTARFRRFVRRIVDPL